MERVLAQGPKGMEAPHSRRVLELNASHPVFDKLVAAQDAGDDEKLALYASLLYDQALLVEGLSVGLRAQNGALGVHEGSLVQHLLAEGLHARR